LSPSSLEETMYPEWYRSYVHMYIGKTTQGAMGVLSSWIVVLLNCRIRCDNWQFYNIWSAYKCDPELIRTLCHLHIASMQYKEKSDDYSELLNIKWETRSLQSYAYSNSCYRTLLEHNFALDSTIKVDIMNTENELEKCITTHTRLSVSMDYLY